jgi:hypothetical protein
VVRKFGTASIDAVHLPADRAYRDTLVRLLAAADLGTAVRAGLNPILRAAMTRAMDTSELPALGEGHRAARSRRGGVMRIAAAVLCLLVAACATKQPAMPPVSEEVLFTGALADLAPLQNGNHFVYRATLKGGGTPLQVEHVSALETPGEFVVSTSEDGAAMGKIHLRVDGPRALMLSEGLAQDDLIVVYEQPLPSFAVPLTTTSLHSSSAVTLLRASTGTVTAHGHVEQTVTAHRAGPNAVGAAFTIYSERILQLPNRVMRLSATTWITPGIGEVRSEGSVDGTEMMRRELLCAIVAGKRVGDKCDQLGAKNPEQ